MNAGKTILNTLVHRIPRSAATYNGQPVTIFLNNDGLPDAPGSLPPETLWRTQPHLRTVVDFICRNVAQLGLHVFERSGDDRKRDRGSDLARLLKRPNPYMTTYDLIYDLVGNLSLHNRAYWFVYRSTTTGEWEIQPFPASWVSVEYDTFWSPKKYVVQPPAKDGKKVTFDPDSVIDFGQWSPVPGETASPVDSLRLVLEEQHHSRKHRVQLWRRNGRVGSYISRPADAPTWTRQDRQRFYKMYESFTGDSGSRAGGVPLLEEGMEVKQTKFTSADEEWATSVKLSLETVAQVYQVNPTMVGVLDNANYSNVKEFNKSLYTNTLGPLIRMIELRINAFLLPTIGVDPDVYFAEFNVNEKLRGSFEEQAAVATSAVGAPYMTRNEMRRLNNLPALDGADDLVTPLNLGTSSVSPEPPDEVPTPREDTELTPGEKDVITRHKERVTRVYSSTKRWDRPRFDRELAADISSVGGDPRLVVEVNDSLEYTLGIRKSLHEN